MRIVVTSLLIAIAVGSPAAAQEVRVWVVGSPYNDKTPGVYVPTRLQEAAGRLGFRLVADAFPARGFAARFHEALSRGAAPDLLAFDNFGVLEGITTPLGTFDGIRENPEDRADLVRVTRTLDDLVPGGRGWVYLVASSPNHRQARRLAVGPPTCTTVGARPTSGELAQLVPRMVTDYLERKLSALETIADPERLTVPRPAKDERQVLDVATCGVWGNQRIAFVQATATYDGEAIGEQQVLLVLRNVSGHWRLLVASRDVISNQQFIRDLASLSSAFEAGDAASAPSAALLLTPPNGQRPRPAASERFGWFEWQPSVSTDVIAEIAEFTFGENSRLFLKPPGPGGRQRVSAGLLLSGGDWIWRVWSITASGEVAFSEARAFSY